MGRASEFSVLIACRSPKEKTSDAFWGWQWGPWPASLALICLHYEQSSACTVASGPLDLPLLAWKLHPLSILGRRWSGSQYSWPAAPEIEPPSYSGSWVEEGSPDLLAALTWSLAFATQRWGAWEILAASPRWDIHTIAHGWELEGEETYMPHSLNFLMRFRCSWMFICCMPLGQHAQILNVFFLFFTTYGRVWRSSELLM